jgi:hypothetical protein
MAEHEKRSIVRDALLGQRRHRLLEMLGRHWDEGKASGLAGPLDIKRILSEERTASENPPQPPG